MHGNNFIKERWGLVIHPILVNYDIHLESIIYNLNTLLNLLFLSEMTGSLKSFSEFVNI